MDEQFVPGKRCRVFETCRKWMACQKASMLSHQINVRKEQGLSPLSDELAIPSCEHPTHEVQLTEARKIIAEETIKPGLTGPFGIK